MVEKIILGDVTLEAVLLVLEEEEHHVEEEGQGVEEEEHHVEVEGQVVEEDVADNRCSKLIDMVLKLF